MAWYRACQPAKQDTRARVFAQCERCVRRGILAPPPALCVGIPQGGDGAGRFKLPHYFRRSGPVPRPDGGPVRHAFVRPGAERGHGAAEAYAVSGAGAASARRRAGYPRAVRAQRCCPARKRGPCAVQGLVRPFGPWPANARNAAGAYLRKRHPVYSRL